MRQVASALILLTCGFTLIAQTTPKAEIFAGFSYANYELISVTSLLSATIVVSPGSPSIVSVPTTTSSARLGLLGWNGSVTADVNRWFGVTTDFSGNYSNLSASITRSEPMGLNCILIPCPATIEYLASRPRIHNFLFGPQFSYSVGKLRPFAHFLVGGSHQSITRGEIMTFTPPAGGPVASSFVGPASSDNQFAIAFGGGVDYPIRKMFAWRLAADYLTNQGSNQNHVRASTGLVWQLGK